MDLDDLLEEFKDDRKNSQVSSSGNNWDTAALTKPKIGAQASMNTGSKLGGQVKSSWDTETFGDDDYNSNSNANNNNLFGALPQ